MVGGLAPGLPWGRWAGGARGWRGGEVAAAAVVYIRGKVNSSCCFKSLGKPRLQGELDPLSECEPEQRYF